MKKEANYKTNFRVKGPKPMAPNLVLLLGLGSEDCHAIHRDDQKVIFHALVSFGETRDKPNFGRPRLKIIARVWEKMAFVHPNNVVPGEAGEAQLHFLIENIYNT